MTATPEQIELVLEAAERRAGEILNQAFTYEKLATEGERLMGTGQMLIVEETMRDHYRPLREAIDAMRSEAGAA